MLLILVAIIWTLIIYKFINFKNPDTTTLIPSKVVIDTTNNTIQHNNFSLNLNYPDPFLKGDKTQQSHRENERTNNVRKTKKSISNKQEEQNSIDIKYMGYIQNQDNNKKNAICIVNRKNELFKEEYTIDSITLKKIWKDSILVSYNDTLIIVKKDFY